VVEQTSIQATYNFDTGGDRTNVMGDHQNGDAIVPVTKWNILSYQMLIALQIC
jgi:hypothetical protein